MKKYRLIKQFLIILYFLSLNLVISGQKIGIKIGLNSSNLGEYEIPRQSFKNMIGINTGLLIIFPKNPIKDLFLFGTGLTFATKGTKEIYVYDHFNMSHNTYYSWTNTYTRKLNYFNLPLNINSIIKIKGSRLIVTSGVYLAYGISGQIDFECTWTNTGNIIDSYNYDVTWTKNEVDDYERFDYGLSAGIGIEKGPFQLLLKAERGLKNIHISNFYTYKKDYITSYGLSISYFFEFK